MNQMLKGNFFARRLNRKTVSFQRDSIDEELAKEFMPQESMREDKRVVGVQPARLDFVVNSYGEDATSWKKLQQQQQQNVPLDNIATPLIVSSLLSQDIEETMLGTLPLTDREKRCLAVPIGDLHDDKKRKLLRTRSIPNRSM